MNTNVQLSHVKAGYVDSRGSITDLINENINHVGYIVTAKGAVRGDHYHKKSFQYSYITKGVFEVLVAHVSTPDQITKYTITTGDLITIPPMIIHQFKAVEEAVMIDMISESREGNRYEADVFRLEYRDGRFILPA